MGLSSIALDIMLVALPEIGAALKATAPNLAQLTIGTFLAGAAISAFMIGPVADAYGRRMPINTLSPETRRPPSGREGIACVGRYRSISFWGNDGHA